MFERFSNKFVRMRDNDYSFLLFFFQFCDVAQVMIIQNYIQPNLANDESRKD